MQGKAIQRRLEEDPELLRAWELYIVCRQQQLIIYEKPTGRKDGSKILTQVLWTNGLSVLPNGVGVLGEDYILLKYFQGFLQGDHQGAAKLMARKGR